MKRFLHNRLFYILFSAILIILFTILAYYVGYASGSNTNLLSSENITEAEDSSIKRQLYIYADVANDSTVISKSSLGGKHNRDIQCRNLSNIRIKVGQKQMPLQNAIHDGYISIAQIFANARIDAENGFCDEYFESKHGLTHFTYTYPEFDMRVIYDIYETPDGSQNLISDLMFFESGSAIGPYTDFYDEANIRLDREDWGITLETDKVTSTSITLKCSQFGGQQIGELVITQFILINQYGFVPELEDVESSTGYQLSIPMGTKSQLTLDWDEIYGELSSGEYIIRLYITDMFDENQVHPLMDDFHDTQAYEVFFSIP